MYKIFIGDKMLIVFFRALVLYSVVFLVIRLMGKKELSKVQPFELAIIIVISDLASAPMSSRGLSLLDGIVPIITLLFAYSIFLLLNHSSNKVQDIVCGKPILIIKNGQIVQKDFDNQKYTVSDIMSQLHEKDIFSIAEVEYGIIETNGNLSIIRKDEKITKIYEKICKKRELSLHLLNELKTYINDTKRNISQVAGALRTDDRTFAASLVLRASTCGHSASSFGILSTGHEAYRRRMLQSRLLRQFAELEGIWYQSKDEFIARNELIVAKDKYGMDIEGMETKLYLCPNDYSAYKFLRLNADCNSLYDNLAERIVLHNLMFGDKTALCIEGLFFENSFITFAVSQPYIEGAMRLTKKEQRTKFFSQFDNFNHKKNCIKNSDLVIGDLHNNNILVDKNGDFYVIDCYAKFYREEDLLNYYNDRESSTPSKNSLRNLSGISNTEMQSRELDIVIKARAIAQNGESLRSRFNAMLELYENQPTIRPTDTKSKLFQQYSTPCPLAFLASEFVKQEGKRYYFEPSAGNGMLTISLPEQFTCVNELDEVRYKNLRKQGFCRVTQLDSSKKIDLYGGSFFDGVITNPPFKSLPKSEQEVRNGFNLATLDYKMAAVALDQMKGVGKAAVIVGGKLFDNYWKPVKGTDKKMLFGQWKVFLGWLYGQYNVVDVIYIGGDYIYRKQGTTYPVVLILINGRHIFDKNKHKPRYIFDPVKDKIIETYEQLFERVSPHLKKGQEEAYYSPLFDNLIKLLKLKNCKTLSGTDENFVKNFQEKICKDGFNSVTLNQLNGNPVYCFTPSLTSAILEGKWSEKAYNELCLILKLIKNGTIRYERLREERFGGETENDRIRRSGLFILGGSRSTSIVIPTSEKRTSGETKRDEKIIRAFAEYQNIWHDSAEEYISQLGGKFHDKGREARVYLSKDEKFVYKIKNDVSHNLLQFLDELTNHNLLFPDTKYEILGFGMDEYGRFCAVLKQKTIKGHPATLKEIEKYFLERGFQKVTNFSYKRGSYIVADLKCENVVSSKGKCFVIDCFAQNLFDFDNNFYINQRNNLSGNLDSQAVEFKYIPKNYKTYEQYIKEYPFGTLINNIFYKDCYIGEHSFQFVDDSCTEKLYEYYTADLYPLYVIVYKKIPSKIGLIKFGKKLKAKGYSFSYSTYSEYYHINFLDEKRLKDFLDKEIFPQNYTEKFSPLFDNLIKLLKLKNGK